MSFTIDKKEQYCIVHSGVEKLDTQNAPDLKSELVVLAKGGVKNFIIDMSATRYCDSSGLGALLMGKRLCRETGGSFVVSGMQEPVARLVKISKLDSVLNLTPTIDEAVDLVMMEELEREIDKED